MKKLTLPALLLAVLLLFGACAGGAQKGEAEFAAKLIDAIGTVGHGSLQALNRAEHAYNALTDAQKKTVANAQTLSDARAAYDALKSVPKRGRLDRTKLNIATYVYRQSLWNDTDMQKLVDAGVNVIAEPPYNKTLLDLCEKYGVSTLVRYLPGPMGLTDERLNELYAAFEDHPAIAALAIVDEPFTDDLPVVGEVTKKVETMFPAGLSYTNLYPGYGTAPFSDTYAEHIAEYVKHVDTDYISYDHYFYANYNNGVAKNGAMFLSDLQDVAAACRETGRDLWIVLQVSDPQALLNDKQMRVQAYGAMSYGATLLNWACWTAGWYQPDLQIVDSQGNYTSMYDDLKAVNHEVLKFSDEYMQYQNIAAFPFGVNNAFTSKVAMTFTEWDGQNVFTSLSIDKKGTGLAGYFEKNDGSGYGLMLTNLTDVMGGEGENTVSFRVPFAASVSATVKGEKTTLTPDADGVYTITLENCGGTFVTVTRDEAAAFRAEVRAESGKAVELKLNASSVGFGVRAEGYENDVAGLSSLGVEFVSGHAGSGSVSKLAAKKIGLFASDTYYRNLAGGTLGLTSPGNLSNTDYTALAPSFQGILFAGNILEHIQKLVNQTPGDAFTIASSSFQQIRGNKAASVRYLPSLAYAGKYSGEAEKALWVALDITDSNAEQLTWQIWSAYAFGAKKVLLNDYAALKSEQGLFEAAKAAIAGVKKLAPAYAAYAYQGVYAPKLELYSPQVSFAEEPKLAKVKTLSSDGTAVFGLFAKENGAAVMVIPGDSGELLAGSFAKQTVTLTLDGTEKKVVAYVDGVGKTLSKQNGVYTVELTGPAGVFVTIE